MPGTPKQLHLFGEPEPDRPVHPAPIDPELAGLAARIPAGLRLGTSSWSFPGWRGILYAARSPQNRLARHGLAAYAQHPLLRAVGIDRTFYAPLETTEFARYAAAVPEHFRFLVKACADCTSPFIRDGDGRPGAPNPHYLDAAFATDFVVGPAVRGLGAKAGALVFQFPPQGPEANRSPEAFADRIASFLAALPPGPTYAVELRDAALMTTRYFEALADANVQHCYAIHPRVPPIERQREWAEDCGPLIVRWMLQPPLGYSDAVQRFTPFSELVAEDPTRRAALAELCASALTAGREALVVINNKAEGSAPLSVFKLAGAIAAELDQRRQ